MASPGCPPVPRASVGTYSEQLKVFAKSLVVLPDSIDDREVPLACGGLTAYGAVKKLNQFSLVPGSTVAVIGAAGGLGHYAVQIARHWGYKVVGVDVGAEKVDFVRSLGAELAVDASEAAEVVRREVPGGCTPAWCSRPSWPGSGWGWTCCAGAACSSRWASPPTTRAASSSARGRCSARTR
ncbi:MAG: zinc-binding dehydrogenase [Acidimicrobiales bacterium]